jgi:hypothetical protein
MTSKSLNLKKILQWSAALVAVGGLVVFGLIAWGLGVRWPTVHHVDQPGLPEYIHIKALDFLDDSGYVVEVHFETCCTDRLVCKLSGAGRLLENDEYKLTRRTPELRIPFRRRGNSICPWAFSHLGIRKAGFRTSPNTHRFAYGIYDDSTSVQNRIDPECLKYLDSRYIGEIDGPLSPEACNVNSSVRVALGKLDTLFLERGAE